MIENSTATGAVFPPALLTLGFSPATKGGEDRVSLAPTAGNLPASIPLPARPFSRLVAEQITANTSQPNMRENSIATVLQRRAAPSAMTLHSADPISPSSIRGPLPRGDYQQCLEWAQLPTELEGQKISKVAERSVAAFRQDPLSMHSMGSQTSPQGPLTHLRPATHEASTSPINFLRGAPSTIGTRCSHLEHPQ